MSPNCEPRLSTIEIEESMIGLDSSSRTHQNCALELATRIDHRKLMVLVHSDQLPITLMLGRTRPDRERLRRGCECWMRSMMRAKGQVHVAIKYGGYRGQVPT